jgi:uncharacterized protein involved in outer membrane biogenesis
MVHLRINHRLSIMKIGKLIKRFFIAIGIIILLFVATAIIVPIFFKDKIMALVKKELNEKLDATTDFKDVDISLFHSFPHLSVSVKDLSIVGKGSFKNDTLISAKSIDITLELMKAIKGTYDVINVGLVTPRIHAIVHSDGAANWNIAKPEPPKPATAAEPSKPFSMKLRKYAIENAFIEYNDEQGKMHVIIENLDHKGSGDFGSDAFTLSTKTTADAITFVNGNISYLNEVRTKIDLDLNIDSKNNKYTFSTEKIQLNGLKLSFKGFVQMPDTNNMVMDIQFNTPSNDFKDILSLMPGIYAHNFNDIKTAGKLTLSGFVKGTYNKTHLPAYKLNLGIQDGMFQFPNLPQKVSNIQVKLEVDNPDGVTDHTVVNLEKCHVDLGTQPFDLRLLLKTPVTDQWIDATAKGKIDLTQMEKFMKFDAGTKLAGTITADVSVKGSMAAAQKKQFEKLDASGTIGFTDITYTAKDYPDGVNLYSLVLTFNPKNVTVANLKGKYLGTIFSGDGSIDNLLGYYLHNESLSGAFHFAADKIDVSKWMGTSSTPPPAKADAAKTPAPASTQPFLVPSNLDISLTASVGTLQYDNITMSAVSGGLSIRNQVVNLQNVNGKALDGSLKISGFYSTQKDKKNPDIQFDYSVTGVDVQKTFNTFNTVQKMMPVGKYISGKITSNLTMTGKLGGDMMPVMNSLTGKGDLLLLSGVLSNFPVTDQLADKLHLTQFKTIKLQDLKLFYSFENGRVTVQPYKMKIGDIDAEIAGSHGFDQTMKYGVNLVVPRSMMGTEANNMVNGLLSQATSKGIPVKLGDKVNLTVTITGTTTNPKIETNLKNVAGDAVNNVKDEIKKEVDKKIDSVRNVVKDTVKAIKTQVVTQTKEEIKKQFLGDTSKKKPDAIIKDAGDDVKKGINDLFHKKK